jgi:hypothetical protein
MLIGYLPGNNGHRLTHAVAQWAVGLPFHILAGWRTVCPAGDVSKPRYTAPDKPPDNGAGGQAGTRLRAIYRLSGGSARFENLIEQTQ